MSYTWSGSLSKAKKSVGCAGLGREAGWQVLPPKVKGQLAPRVTAWDENIRLCNFTSYLLLSWIIQSSSGVRIDHSQRVIVTRPNRIKQVCNATFSVSSLSRLLMFVHKGSGWLRNPGFEAWNIIIFPPPDGTSTVISLSLVNKIRETYKEFHKSGQREISPN